MVRIKCAFISFVVCIFFRNGQIKRRSLKLFSVLILMLLVGTGHLGASLTHGSDYLTEPLIEMTRREDPPVNLTSLDLSKPILLRVDQPIFEKRCTSCHGEESKKENSLG